MRSYSVSIHANLSIDVEEDLATLSKSVLLDKLYSKFDLICSDPETKEELFLDTMEITDVWDNEREEEILL